MSNCQVSVKDIPFNAVGDGSNDDTQSFINALAYCSANKIDLIIPTGVYRVNQSLTWNASTHSIIGIGTPSLNFGEISGFAFNVVGQSKESSVFGQQLILHRISNLKIVGTDKDNTTTDCFNIDDSENVSNVSLEHLCVYGFRDQIHLGNSAYLLHFEKCGFEHFHRYGLDIDCQTNAGENISFYSCVFASSKNSTGNAIAVYTQKTSNADIYFYGCSFDYNDIEFNHNAGNIVLMGCHIEDNSEDAMFRLSYTSGRARTYLTLSSVTLSPTNNANNNPNRKTLFSSNGDHVVINVFGTVFETYNMTNLYQIVQGNPHVSWKGGEIQSGPVTPVIGTVVNQIRNGSFETGNLTGWEQQGGISCSVVNAQTPEGGSHVLQVVGTEQTGNIYQPFTCLVGEILQISCWVNTRLKSGIGQLVMQFRDGLNNNISSIKVGSQSQENEDWQRIAGSVAVPVGAQSCWIMFTVNGIDGVVCLGDIIVNRI